MWVEVLWYPPPYLMTAASGLWMLMRPGENFIRYRGWVDTTTAAGG